MDICLAAALSLPQKQARRPAKGNEIAPSKFRPHVPADRRILLWTTPHSLISQIQRDSEISRRLQTLMYEGLLSSTVDDTRQAYGAGLLRFNQFCDAEMIPESSRMPASPTLLGAFVANYIGSGTGKMIWNWLSGLRLWHIYNEAHWHGKEGWLPALTKAADKKGTVFMRPPRGPITNDHLQALRNSLDLSLPRDAAIWAAAVTAFWGCRRLGELLICSLTKFTIEHDVTRSTRISRSSVNNHRVISIHIPWTKTTGTLGAECLLTETFDNFCHVWAFQNHLRINHSPTELTPLFSYHLDNNTWSPLLKSNFLSFTTFIFKNSGLENVFGHSYRIGGSLKLLLDGVAPEIIMKLGGWTSLCFLIYWRRLEQVLPAAITRAWAARIKEFTLRNGLNSDVVELDFE
ncbi:DNA breaking-rejoining enzyme [Gymnopus androsaceus JB14]|uniref:DNA breaking-rejoining enzyme n=1 Tax=Gymnopus androsaceus JB14 TaxID=1447944 RepID=A0A6A4HHP2_9AGAR|nr:DNA breaking-rejoining enzyme [Gymnopus androsaceus JB14]